MTPSWFLLVHVQELLQIQYAVVCSDANIISSKQRIHAYTSTGSAPGSRDNSNPMHRLNRRIIILRGKRGRRVKHPGLWHCGQVRMSRKNRWSFVPRITTVDHFQTALQWLIVNTVSNIRNIFTGLTNKLLLSFIVISDMYRSYIPNQTTFTKYFLTQWISKLPGSFEIHWSRQHRVNFTGLAEHCLEQTKLLSHTVIGRYNSVSLYKR